MYRRKRIDPRVIGIFVVGAVILSVAGLLFFGPGGFLAETRSYVVYFNSSVKGLNVGSPVRFRGVKIGQVREISVQIRPSDFKFQIPVVIQIELSRIKAIGSKQGLLEALKSTVRGGDPMLSLVDKGLRAQMQLDSLVTGQLYVNFDMYPDTPIVLTSNTTAYPELPSISSSLNELTKTLEDFPLQKLADKLMRSADGFEKFITSPHLHSALAKLDTTASRLNQLLKNLDEQLFPLVDMFKEILQKTQITMNNVERRIDPLAVNIERTLQDVQATISHIDSKVNPLSLQLSGALQSFDDASVKAAAAMQQIKGLTSADSLILEQLTLTLHEVQRTARTVRYLTTELEHDPQMLLRGRVNEGTK